VAEIWPSEKFDLGG